MSPRSVLLGGLLAACVAGLTGSAGGDDKNSKKYDSPKAVFQAATAAAKKKDWKTFYGCLTRDAQEVWTGQVAFLGLLLQGFAQFDKTGKTAEKLAPLTKIYDKHGLTKEKLEQMKKDAPKPTKDPREAAKAFKALAAPIKDKVGFTSEVIAFLDKTNPKKQDNPLAAATLKDVKIDGDKATGTVLSKQGDKERKETITFVKKDGNWKMGLPQPPAKDDKKADK